MVAQKPHGISTGHGEAFRRPSGTPALPEFEPGNELPGYFRVSLRDKCAEKALSDPAAARGVVGAASCDLADARSPGQQVVRATRNVARRRCIECGSGTPAGVRAIWGSFPVVSMVRRWGVGDGGTPIGAFDWDEGPSHLLFRPFRAGGFFYRLPRALPWAILCRPFRAKGRIDFVCGQAVEGVDRARRAARDGDHGTAALREARSSGIPAGTRASWGSFRVVSMIRRLKVGDGGTHIRAFDWDEGASHLLFRPFRARGFFYRLPRALPWAILCRPFRAKGRIEAGSPVVAGLPHPAN
jgi:hypothetical protein